MRPRKWSDKSRPGALRIPNSVPPKKDGIVRVDPFSECSAAFYKFKVAQGQEFRRRKRDSDRWKRHQLAFEKRRTEVNACKVTVNFFFQILVQGFYTQPFIGSCRWRARTSESSSQGLSSPKVLACHLQTVQV